MKTLKTNVSAALVVLFLANAISLKSQTQVPANAWKNYNDTIAKRMKEWNIPGMAIVVVKGDSVLFSNTYGYADVENKVKVTPQTLFAIGSCTKFFTTTGLSVLADEKKIDFNDPVITYYPELKLKDTLLRKEISMNDILSHGTGLESGDYIWYGADYSRQEVLNRLIYLDKVAPVRSAFIYNNMMYTVAGTIIEKQSGSAYETFISSRILTPLKMNSTFFDLSKTKSSIALPYNYSGNNFRKLPMPLLKGVEPAGAIWSDLEDMTKWLKFHLGEGKTDTTQLVSEESMRRLKTPVHFTGQRMHADESEYKSYGLGMGFTSYKGNRVMYHTGVAGGYTAHMALLPEKNIGIMILTNTETYTTAMVDNIFDRVLGLEQTDWNTPVIAAVQEQRKEGEKETAEKFLKIKNGAAIKNASEYAGGYGHLFCRPVEIITKNNKLFLKYNSIEYPMVQEKETEFMSYDPIVFGDIITVFDKDPKGTISGLTLKLMGQELVYKKTK